MSESMPCPDCGHPNDAGSEMCASCHFPLITVDAPLKDAGGGPQPGLFGWIRGWGDGGAERGRYADFLDEAAVLLKKPNLKSAASLFRQSQMAWQELARTAFPETVPAFSKARELLTRRGRLFVEQGGAALKERQSLNTQLDDLGEAVSDSFPLTDAQAAELRRQMSTVVLKIHDIEYQAVETMQAAIE